MNINEVETMLNSLPSQELKERFARHYGHIPTTRNRAHLIKKILWATQRDALGDISETARKKALAIADDRDVKGRFQQKERPAAKTGASSKKVIAYQPRLELLPGTVLHRKYRDKNIRVLVLENGFEWNGQYFKSLSATARAVTGTRWNGKLFFGLKKGGK